jgi:hypothetical protein
MEFLSNLSTMQRAAGAVILVLLLVVLLAKQRKAKSAPAGATAEAKPEKQKQPKARSTKSKSLSFGKSRKKKGDAEASEEFAEPKSASGRMVPRLPAAAAGEEPVDTGATGAFVAPDPEEAPALEAAAPVEVTGDAMISEPGWPTPGEVWAAPGAAPVQTEAAEESWRAPDNGVGDHDDALAALTESPSAASPSWDAEDADSFDPATGWGEPDETEDAPADPAPGWEQPAAEEEQFDWTAGDALDGWATAADEDETTPEAPSDGAAWESPEDEAPVWSASDESPWEAPATEEEPAAVATAVAESDAERFSSDAWDVPVEAAAEETPEADEPPTVMWDPVEEPEAEVDADVDTAVAEPVFEPVAVAEPEPVAVADPIFEPVAVAEPEPIAVVFEPVAVTEPEPTAVATPVFLTGAVVSDPVSRWASMVPGGVEEAQPAVDPTSSWARLQPGRHAAPSNGAVAPVAPQPAPVVSPVAAALAPSPSAAPSVAWWDVPSGTETDPRRGRFALGGYALQPGHQVVSGVTFRDGVVPPPSHWVIGPVVGAVAPGTLILLVDGCLNCDRDNLAVIMDPGFAPTTDGFSLKLTASEQGPFAASGTYVIA